MNGAGPPEVTIRVNSARHRPRPPKVMIPGRQRGETPIPPKSYDAPNQLPPRPFSIEVRSASRATRTNTQVGPPIGYVKTPTGYDPPPVSCVKPPNGYDKTANSLFNLGFFVHEFLNSEFRILACG
jgi:hypothetical protein